MRRTSKQHTHWAKQGGKTLAVLFLLFALTLTACGDTTAWVSVSSESQNMTLDAEGSVVSAAPSVAAPTTPTPSVTVIASPAPTPEPTPEPTPANLFLQAEVHTASDSSGTWAYILFDPADMTAVSEPDYKEFCDTTVADAKAKGYSHFTVDFQNGTGIVYPGCSAALADYAYLNESGLTGTLIYSIGYQNGSISYITPTPAPTPTPTPEPVAEPVGTTVYITNTGSKYHVNGCQYLSKSQIAISLSDAKSQGYEPCKRCNPPT